MASSTLRSSGESSVCIRSIVAAYCSLAMACSSGSGPGWGSSLASGKGTLKFSGACFLRRAARRASCWAWVMQAAAKDAKAIPAAVSYRCIASNRPIRPSCTASSKSRPGAVAAAAPLRMAGIMRAMRAATAVSSPFWAKANRSLVIFCMGLPPAGRCEHLYNSRNHAFCQSFFGIMLKIPLYEPHRSWYTEKNKLVCNKPPAPRVLKVKQA